MAHGDGIVSRLKSRLFQTTHSKYANACIHSHCVPATPSKTKTLNSTFAVERDDPKHRQTSPNTIDREGDSVQCTTHHSHPSTQRQTHSPFTQEANRCWSLAMRNRTALSDEPSPSVTR